MKYKYIPASYNMNLINSKFDNEDLFINTQILYRKGLEKIISDFIDFKEIDKWITNTKVSIPIIMDHDYNFYHQYSYLGSNYLYLRNNFHVEELTKEEIQQIIKNENISQDFYNKTLEKVIFEPGDETFFGEPMDETIVKSKSIVFEFAYDQKKCTSIEQLRQIKQIITEVFKYIQEKLKDKLNIKISFIVYNALPDLYYTKKSIIKFN